MKENNPHLGNPQDKVDSNVENSDSSLDVKTALHTAENQQEVNDRIKSSPEENEGLGNKQLGKASQQQDNKQEKQ